MKTHKPYAILIMTVPFILACGLLAQPSSGVSQVPPTRTPLPAFTPTSQGEAASPTPIDIPTDMPLPTDTPAPVADTPIPTDTPEPLPTDTPEPAPTDTPVPPPPTNTPAPPPPPTNTPAPPPPPPGPAVGQFGVSGKVIARDKTTFAVGEKAFFTYEAINHGENPVPFTLLGIKASNGHFNTSWINPDIIKPGEPFRHDDGLVFDVPGTYQVFLAICFTGCDGGGAVWEEYHGGAATITVQ